MLLPGHTRRPYAGPVRKLSGRTHISLKSLNFPADSSRISIPSSLSNTALSAWTIWLSLLGRSGSSCSFAERKKALHFWKRLRQHLWRRLPAEPSQLWRMTNSL
eukprot:5870286-Pleurochrysis_carterae.AAC.1